MANKKISATRKEVAAIDAVKVAIKALPRSVYFTTDEIFGIEFWKRSGPDVAYGVTRPLHCKRAISP